MLTVRDLHRVALQGYRGRSGTYEIVSALIRDGLINPDAAAETTRQLNEIEITISRGRQNPNRRPSGPLPLLDRTSPAVEKFLSNRTQDADLEDRSNRAAASGADKRATLYHQHFRLSR